MIVITDRNQWPKARPFPASGGSRPGTGPITLPDLRVDGRVWRDGGRLWVPRLVSHLTALTPDRFERDWEAYFAWAAATGFTGTRVFGGALTWASQRADDARRRLPAYLDMAASFGLVVEVSAITDSGEGGYDTDDHVQRIAEIIRPRKGHVLLELANEVGHGTQADHVTPDYLRALGEQVASDLLWAVGSTGDEPDGQGRYDGAGGRYATGHMDRGRDLLNQVRRVRELYAIVESTNSPCLDNERLGADEVDGSVSGKQRTDQPWFFFAAGVLDRCYPGVGGVHHSQAGLMAELPGPVQQACAQAEIDGHAIAAEVLGDDVPHYSNAGHHGAPVLNPGGSEAFEDRGHEGGTPGPIIRAPSFVVGGRALTVVLHRPDQYPAGVLQFGNGWRPRPALTPFSHVTLIESDR